MGAVNGGTKTVNGQAVETSSLEPIAQYIADKVLEYIKGNMNVDIESIAKENEFGMLEPQTLFVLDRGALSKIKGYAGIDATEALNVKIDYDEEGDFAAAYNKIDDSLTYSYLYVKGLILKGNMLYAQHKLNAVTLHELTHFANSPQMGRSFNRNASDRAFSEEIANSARGILYLLTPTEMNARVSEFYGIIKGLNFGKLYKVNGRNLNKTVSYILNNFESTTYCNSINTIINEIENADVNGATPDSKDNIVLALMKMTRGCNVGKIKFPSLSYVFGQSTNLSDEEYNSAMLQSIINSHNNGGKFIPVSRKRYNQFTDGKVTQEIVDERMAKCKQSIVSQMKRVASNYRSKLNKIAFAWAEEKEQDYKDEMLLNFLTQMRSADVNEITNNILGRLLGE